MQGKTELVKEKALNKIKKSLAEEEENIFLEAKEEVLDAAEELKEDISEQVYMKWKFLEIYLKCGTIKT